MSRSKILIILLLIPMLAWGQQDSTRQRWRQRMEQLREKSNQAYNRLDSLRGSAHDKAMTNEHARHADSLMTAMEERSRRNYDTLYIFKPRQKWTLKLRTNLSGNEMVVHSNYNGDDRRADMHAAHKLTFTIGLGFRGINISFAANPLKWAGKNKDFEYNLNSYSNRYGFDVIYTNANTFRGRESMGGTHYDIEAGDVRQKMLTVNGYYAFNYRRFSFPAAFTQSQVQRRSAGSWLLSMMFLDESLKHDTDAGMGDITLPSSVLHTYSLGIGGGYGYNLVLPHSWLIHASLTPEVVVYNHSNLKLNGEKSKMPYRFPNFMTVARGAVVHNWEHYFAALSIVFNYGDIGDYDSMRLYQFKWRLRATWGFRI